MKQSSKGTKGYSGNIPHPPRLPGSPSSLPEVNPVPKNSFQNNSVPVPARSQTHAHNTYSLAHTFSQMHKHAPRSPSHTHALSHADRLILHPSGTHTYPPPHAHTHPGTCPLSSMLVLLHPSTAHFELHLACLHPLAPPGDCSTSG